MSAEQSERGERRPVAVVADDEVHIADLVAVALEPLGLEVVKVHNGERALQAVAEHRACLLVSDVMMPAMRGDEACRRLKADPETSHIIVVLVSSQPKHQLLSAGADAYVGKPFDLDRLEALITQLLSQARCGHIRRSET